MALSLAKRITEYKLAKDLFVRGKEIIISREVQEMKKYTQHGRTTVFEHCVAVAKYFLYDWHIKGHAQGLHGFTHPSVAIKNAVRDFDLNRIEKDVIVKHMFPLTPFPPRYLESYIVSVADKWCATAETFKIDISSYLIARINYSIEIANIDSSICPGVLFAES